MFRFVCLLLIALALPLAAAAREPSPQTRQHIAAGAQLAQVRCYRLIHHDTFDYESCLNKLLTEQKWPLPQRLGIEYFGAVGALNSARLGMLGADHTAWQMLRRARASQKRIGISDAALCQSVPGDCEVRVARIKLIEAGPAPKPVSEGEDGHAH